MYGAPCNRRTAINRTQSLIPALTLYRVLSGKLLSGWFVTGVFWQPVCCGMGRRWMVFSTWPDYVTSSLQSHRHYSRVVEPATGAKLGAS